VHSATPGLRYAEDPDRTARLIRVFASTLRPGVGGQSFLTRPLDLLLLLLLLLLPQLLFPR
jgi:hypothetical protein